MKVKGGRECDAAVELCKWWEAVDEVGKVAMMIEVGYLSEVAASFLVGRGRG